MRDRGGARRPGGVVALAALAGIALVALVIGPAGTAGARGGGCPNRLAEAHSVSLDKLRQAITCLVRHKRHQRGLGRLHANHDLRRAANKHTDVMLRKNCFKHNCPGEPGLGRRIRRTGYLDGAKHFAYAENLGYARTPKEMLDVWMDSRFDRGNILSRTYDDFGVGAGWGSPKHGVPNRGWETYTIVFAHRRR